MPSEDEAPKSNSVTMPTPTQMLLATTPNGNLDNHAEQQQDLEEQTVRQVTQTDHLNKRLLKSFLERFNAGDLCDIDAERNTNNQANNNDEFED